MKSYLTLFSFLYYCTFFLSGCSLMQGLDPKLLDYHYRPKRSAYFFSKKPTKNQKGINKCLSGMAKSCVDVAAKMIQEENEKGAYKFFEIACNLDYAKGCFGAGNIENDKGNIVSANGFYKKGCRYKFGPACFALAEINYLIKDDENKEFQYETYGHACDLRSDYGCVRLGELFYKEGNYGLSKYYFHRSCSLKNELGCYNLGFIFYKEKNLIKSLESLRLSCKYGQAEGCYQMARHYGHHENDEYVFIYLNEAFKYNYTNWERIEFDKHFDFLRTRGSFRELIDSFLLSKRQKTLDEKSDHMQDKVTPPFEQE
jgi:uncharacterized protein